MSTTHPDGGKQVSVVVATRNRPTDIDLLLAAIAACDTGVLHEVILVDDCSDTPCASTATPTPSPYACCATSGGAARRPRATSPARRRPATSSPSSTTTPGRCPTGSTSSTRP